MGTGRIRLAIRSDYDSLYHQPFEFAKKGAVVYATGDSHDSRSKGGQGYTAIKRPLAAMGRRPAPDGLNHLVQFLEETRPIAPGKRRRTASDIAGGAQIGHQIAHGNGLADIVFGERLAVGAERKCARL